MDTELLMKVLNNKTPEELYDILIEYDFDEFTIICRILLDNFDIEKTIKYWNKELNTV